eukprot:SAG11_NODE_6710_length_1261_cov_2.115318_1_plen_49_part_10
MRSPFVFPELPDVGLDAATVLEPPAAVRAAAARPPPAVRHTLCRPRPRE